MLKRLAVLSLTFAMLCLAILPAAAQDTALNFRQAAEYDIGFDCPIASALDPTSTVLWVLMKGCITRHFSLQGFNLTDGTLVNPDGDQFASTLATLDDPFLYSDTLPLTFTDDKTLDLIYAEVQDYDPLNLRLTLDSSPPPADARTFLPTIANLNKLIPGFEGYPEATVYSPDHTLAVVIDTSRFHVIDLKSGVDFLQIDAMPDTNASKVYFSAGGQSLYIATFDHPDDMTDYSATLRLYSLPSGDLMQTYPVPSGLLYISPDGRFAAAQPDDDTFLIVELATGKTSASFRLHEDPHPVTQCLNTGKEVRGLDFQTSGNLYLIDLQWLPDTLSFFTVQSYGGEAAGGGTPCVFNYSRLRRYVLGNS